jgi:hypothetical protein
MPPIVITLSATLSAIKTALLTLFLRLNATGDAFVVFAIIL